RSPRRRHAADRSVRTGIEREEYPVVAEEGVELLARHSGFDHAVEIFGMNGQHPVHIAKIDGNAPERRIDLAFKRRSDAKWNDRQSVGGASAYDCLHIVRGGRNGDRVRWLVRYPGRGVAVLCADRRRNRQTIAQQPRQLCERSGPSPLSTLSGKRRSVKR